MYGQDQTRKIELYDVALKDEKVSPRAKEWLKGLK
jgi:hypothetical protein